MRTTGARSRGGARLAPDGTPVGRLLVLLGLAGFLLGACGGEGGPRWVELARLSPTGSLPQGEVPGGARLVLEEGERWLVAPLPRAAWRNGERPGWLAATMPVIAVGSPRDGSPPYRLVAGARRFEYEPDLARFGSVSGRFTTDAAEGLRLGLALPEGEEAPAEAELWACLALEQESGGVRRIAGRRLSGAGTWLPAGHAREFALAIPPESRLGFALAVEPLYGERGLRTAPQVVRVRLDGALLLEERVEVDVLGEALRWLRVELPRGGVQRAQLAFEVEGPLALTSVLGGVVGPAEPGRSGERPAADEPRPPDLVVFLADTFRADNLEAYGSTLGLTPAIDRFAREARTFERAWSTSTHTLPAHSSLFSGVFPHQNGQVDYFHPLPGAVETLAERLAAIGYRCGLISDGVMVSQSHGLGQGFEVFDERRESGTLARARAFLDGDDGRPLFLFVQTYATHTPYAMSAATRERWKERLLLDRSYDEVMASELLRSAEGLGAEAPPSAPADQETAARLRDLYRAGVTELDAVFGAFRAELEGRGLLPGGWLFFTSDHGEAFFEHGRPFHANRVFEEELRVPLLVAGPGLAPGRDPRPVSLIDLPPTLLGLAGLGAPPEWRGHSLLALPEERVIYAFQSNRTQAGSTLALIDGTRKVIAFDDLEAVRAGRLHKAFDLARDPAELESLHPAERWPAELLEAHRAELERMLTPLVAPEELRLTPEELEEMRKFGYGGESGH